MVHVIFFPFNLIYFEKRLLISYQSWGLGCPVSTRSNIIIWELFNYSVYISLIWGIINLF